MTAASRLLPVLPLPIALACGWGSPAPAAAEEQKASVTGAAVGSVERFGRHEDSFAVWNRMRNNGWAGADEWALRAHYSLKYTFCGPRLASDGEVARRKAETDEVATLCTERPGWRDVELFFAYTGEFDFYAGTRRSGPVINRISQPGFFARVPLSLMFAGRQPTESLELGLQHRSDGQTTDTSLGEGRRAANVAYASGDRAFFDTVSRGANFASIAWDQRGPDLPGQTQTSWRAGLKLYFGAEESAVTWGPLQDQGRRFADYDRLTLRATARTGSLTFDAEWRLGDKGLATDSWTLGAEWLVGGVPLYLRVHQGPMNTLSNFTQRQDSIGFGLRFARF